LTSGRPTATAAGTLDLVSVYEDSSMGPSRAIIAAMPGMAGQLQIGQIFAGDFRLVRPLNEGGMGAVFVVEQVSTGRERALKVMHADLVSDPTLRKRFVQEARVGARIESDHVVEVIAAGIDDASGMPWLVMELLRGEDLDSLLQRKGKLSLAESAAVFDQLCHALSAAHAVGVVHRDLKPENVFLSLARSAAVPFVVKVLDFGIAKVLAEGTASTTAAMGSPLWMAPEQTEPGRAVTPATDVWALGLIAFRMLSGVCYWKGASAEGSSPVMLLREVVLDPIVAASERLRALGSAATLPAGFDEWFARCVDRNPEARFRSAQELYQAWSEMAGPAGNVTGLVVVTDSSASPLAPTISGPPGTTSPVSRSPSEDAEEDTPPRSRPSGTLAPHRRIWLWVAVIAALLVGVVFGVQKVIHSAEQAAARVIASADQNRQLQDDLQKTEELKKKILGKRAEVDRLHGRMIAIPRGAFQMGSDSEELNEKPVHREELQPFELDENEVSIASYQLCVSAGKCTPPATGAACNWSFPDRRAHPVNCISAEQAAAFCDYAAKRLPTEEEWEYAARGAGSTLFPWGATEPSRDACWRRATDAGAAGTTCPIAEGNEDRSSFGIRNMSGNVQEWTSSPYCPYARSGCGASSRVIRGGSWRSTDPQELRAARRLAKEPGYQSDDVGLRCARSPL